MKERCPRCGKLLFPDPDIGMFDQEELNLLRQWCNSLQDTNPKYLTEGDGDLQMKIARLMSRTSSE